MKFTLCVLGAALLIEGIPWFACPEKTRDLLLQLTQTPPSSLRKIGLAMMVGGLLLAHLGKM